MAPRLDELRLVWLACDKVLQVECQQEPVGNPLVWEADSVINNWINQASVGTATPDRWTILCDRVHKGKSWSAQD